MGNKILYFSIILIGIFSCQKDENTLNDYELFGRLQSGSGSWQIIQVDEWDNTEIDPTITTTYPENDFFHFYIKSEQIGLVLVASNTGDNYLNGELSFSSLVQAETERVAFVTGGIAEGTVWTVVENEKNRQVWLRTYGSENFQITMEKCNCELPDPVGETGG